MNKYMNNIANLSHRLTLGKACLGMALLCTAPALTSCGDFLDQDSDRVILADEDHLNNATDTIYSVIGIMNKLQAIADRTVLLGELRGDLVDINSTTSADLRDVALFNVGDSNAYNRPRDYYAVINNCNYFLAKADTALKNNRNEYIFHKEYAAVKAFRAWTYLQLALNYGRVPFVTEPILTKEQADKDYPMQDIQGICQYFINDLTPYATEEMPGYGLIRNTDSRYFYFPIYALLGEFNLWSGNYREAALCYYRFLSTRNGTNSAFPTGTRQVVWSRDDAHWLNTMDSWTLNSFGTTSELYSSHDELITMIPGDSIPSEGNYSELRNLFNSTQSNGYKPSIVPSQSLINLSEAQTYCHLNSAGDVSYAPKGLTRHRSGDLRLSSAWNDGDGISLFVNGQRVENYQSISKYVTQHVHVLRLSTIYLHLAEALNRAGFPRFAFAILKTGVNNSILQRDVIPYYENDADFLAQFNFPNSQYILQTMAENSDENTIGIHSHGSGWSSYNEHYTLPDDTTLTGNDRLNYQIEGVEDLIVDEEALELAFEGTRFYDLMRVALRRNDPSYLANKVYGRRGSDNVETMRGLIKKDLTNPQNWYLGWNGKIGY